MKDLAQARQEVANDIYTQFDFGAAVVAQNGWEYTTPGREMTRIVYLEPSEVSPVMSDNVAQSEKAVLHIVFKSCNSSEMSEAYALLLSNGEFVGESISFS